MVSQAIRAGGCTCSVIRTFWRTDFELGARTASAALRRLLGGTELQDYYSVALVTLVAGLVCFGMALTVARAHSKTGILAPAMTGDAYLERCIRAHINTLEWMLIFLPALWLFAVYWSAAWAAIIGAAWVLGRILYFLGYIAAPQKRFPGFFIQLIAVLVLSLGALGRVVYLIAVT
ncbi:MAG: MAPEG family protein [Steroidobacteraceae bacterium]